MCIRDSLDTDVVFQADGCSRSASGTTTLTQRTITPGAVAVHEDLCMTDLAAKYTAVMLKQGLTNEKEEVPFEEIYFAQKIAKVQDALGKAYWQGDTTSGAANLSKFDGLDKQILAAGTYPRSLQSFLQGLRKIHLCAGQNPL